MASEETRFREAFETYADGLFRHAYFRLSDRERAYDLVQDAFLRAWDHVSLGNEVRHYKSFLYRILHNLIIDEYRRKKSGSLDEMLEDETRAPATEALMAEGSLEETMSALDEQARVDDVLSHLPELSPAYREIITLRYIDGLEIAEIAELLGVSENVVSVRIFRALAKLRALCINHTP